MAEPQKLYTLTEVAQRTGISMPTLQRYKKAYQDRIPAEGKGRTQRYPEDAIAVFEALKQENASKRGRPRKAAAGAAPEAAAAAPAERPKRVVRRGGPAKAAAKVAPVKKKVAKAATKPVKRRGAAKVASKPAARAVVKRGARPAAAAGKSGDGLLSLTEIGKLTGISYPTLMRYVRQFLHDLPHIGEGRRRRFKQEAIERFRELRQRTARGRRLPAPSKATRGAAKRPAAAPEGSFAARLKDLEKAHKALAGKIESVLAKLEKPIKIVLSRR